jgi:hypothetical protein
MGINSKTRENVLDADVSYPEGPYGSGSYSNVVTLEVIVQGSRVRFTSEPLTSSAEAEKVARYLDGKRIEEPYVDPNAAWR